MPQIQRFRRSVRAPRIPRGARLPVNGGGLGGVLSQVAQGLEVLGRSTAKLEAADAFEYASRVSANASRHFSIRLPAAKREAPEGANGFAGTVHK